MPSSAMARSCRVLGSVATTGHENAELLLADVWRRLADDPAVVDDEDAVGQRAHPENADLALVGPQHPVEDVRAGEEPVRQLDAVALGDPANELRAGRALQVHVQ